MREYLDRSMSFEEYSGLVEQLAKEGGTTGTERSESLVNYTRLNRQRMSRVAKTQTLDDSTLAGVRNVNRTMYWLIIVESWCGDVAQNIPVIEKIANAASGIETRYVLRDENPALMDQYLENGARSIPKLIALDRETLEVLGTWGSRPKELKAYYKQLKDEGLEKAEISERLQRWYNEDKGRSLQREFLGLIREWGGRKTAAASV